MSETVEIRGTEVSVDPAAMKTWKAFHLFRAIEESESVFAKADAAFELTEMVSGLTEADIVERCGGETADIDAVLGFALDVVKAASPKN